jgi:hypothetical protein
MRISLFQNYLMHRSINMHIEIKGDVGQVIVVEAGASPTIHIGGGRASVYGNGSGVSNRCPIKQITASQRTEWAKKCIGATAPEGWTAESFSSPKAFSDATIPDGVTKGDPIFFWKRGCDQNSAPDGFTLVYLSEDGVGVVVPADATLVTTNPNIDEGFSFSHTSSMPEEDDEDDSNDSPPPPPPQETTTLSFEED